MNVKKICKGGADRRKRKARKSIRRSIIGRLPKVWEWNASEQHVSAAETYL